MILWQTTFVFGLLPLNKSTNEQLIPLPEGAMSSTRAKLRFENFQFLHYTGIGIHQGLDVNALAPLYL